MNAPIAASGAASAPAFEATAHANRASRLTVRGLSHAYGQRGVLSQVEFAVGEREIVGLLGQNGSGKSTALALLAGLLPWRSGQLTFDGREIRPSDRAYRRQLGVVFQTPSLDQKLSARENLALSLSMHGIVGASARSRIDECLRLAELVDRAHEPVRTFSGGMRRRLDLARAMAHRPRLLVLDEPTAGLDEAAFRRLWTAVLRLRDDEGISVLVATHRPDEAALCTRLVVLHQGKMVASASPSALIDGQASDVLTLELEHDDAAQVQALRRELAERFAVEVCVDEGRLQVACERGHELLVKIVEHLPRGRLRALTLSRPTLADVFLQLTGESLAASADVVPVNQGVRR